MIKLKSLLKESLLKEAIKSPEEAIEYLKGLASTGKLEKSDIDKLHSDIMSARHKFIASKRTPQQRIASAGKGKNTRVMNKIEQDACMEINKKFGYIESDDTTSDKPDAAPNAFALSINLHMNKRLQHKWNAEVRNLIIKNAAKAGITDQAAINSALNMHRDH